MKQFRSTIILLVLVGGFALYAYFGVFKKQKQEEEVREQQSVIIPVEKDKVTKIRVEKSGQITELLKEGGEWKLTSPVQDLADEDVVDGLLNGITAEKSESEISDKDLDYKVFGVDQPTQKISLESEGKTTTVSVGSDAIGGKLYLRRNDEPTVLVASSSWRGHGEKTAKDLRNKSIYRVQGKTVKEIGIESTKQKFKLQKDGEKWSLVGTPGIELGTQEVQNYVHLIENLKANEVVAEDKSDKSQLSKHGLNSPMVKVTLGFTDSTDPWTLTLSSANKAQEAFTYASNLKPIYKLFGASATQFVKVPGDFRDKSKPFQFQRDEVKEIEVKTDLAQVELVNKDGKWQMKKEDPAKEVDQSQVDTFISQLHSFKAKDFLKDKSINTKRKLALKDQSGKVILELGWSDPIKEKNEYKVKSSLSSEIVTLEGPVLNTLPFQSLVKDKTAAAPAPPTSEAHPADDGHGH